MANAHLFPLFLYCQRHWETLEVGLARKGDLKLCSHSPTWSEPHIWGFTIIILTFFHVDLGKEVPSRTIYGGEVHPETAPLQPVCCALRTTKQSALRGGGEGRKGAEKRGGRGVASEGGQKG